MELQLRFNRGLVDHGPHLIDLPIPELIEHVFGEDDAPAVDVDAEKFSLRPAVEAEPACDGGRIRHQQLNVEIEVRDLCKVPLQHRAIARQTDLRSLYDTASPTNRPSLSQSCAFRQPI